jgi:hypothetical protein
MPLLALYLILPDNGFDPRDITPDIPDGVTVFQILRDGLTAKPKQLLLQGIQFFNPFIRP